MSCAVMAHPKREHFVPSLVEAIGGDVRVVWDERNDRIETGARSLLAYEPGATHHAVIQDDAIVCTNLRPALEQLVELVPDNPISLYTGRTRPRQYLVRDAVREAKNRRLSWVVFDELFWGVGVVLPVALIEQMRAYYEDRYSRLQNYDAKMSAFFVAQKARVFYTYPSLVNHRDVAENPSLVAGRTAAGRVAYRFIGDRDPLNDVEWTKKAVCVDRHGDWRVLSVDQLTRRSASEKS